MAKINAPFLSTFASGSIGKVLTCAAFYGKNTFHMQLYRRAKGCKKQIQKDNARVFRIRSKVVKQAHDIFNG